MSILDSIAKGSSLFPRFGASLHPSMIFSGLAYKRSYAHAYTRSAAPLWRRIRQLKFPVVVVALYPALIL